MCLVCLPNKCVHGNDHCPVECMRTYSWDTKKNIDITGWRPNVNSVFWFRFKRIERLILVFYTIAHTKIITRRLRQRFFCSSWWLYSVHFACVRVLSRMWGKKMRRETHHFFIIRESRFARKIVNSTERKKSNLPMQIIIIIINWNESWRTFMTMAGVKRMNWRMKIIWKRNSSYECARAHLHAWMYLCDLLPCMQTVEDVVNVFGPRSHEL